MFFTLGDILNGLPKYSSALFKKWLYDTSRLNIKYPEKATLKYGYATYITDFDDELKQECVTQYTRLREIVDLHIKELSK